MDIIGLVAYGYLSDITLTSFVISWKITECLIGWFSKKDTNNILCLQRHVLQGHSLSSLQTD